MKPRNILSVIILPLLMLTLQHCDEGQPKPKTELEKLPPPTQSGKRTFGCLVDGKAWVIEMPTAAQAYYQTGSLGIFAGLLNPQFNSAITIDVFDLGLTQKTYELMDGSAVMTNGAGYFDHRTSCDYETSETIKGSITITHLDKTNFIISGLFEFDAYSADCTKVVKITDGRFDIHYAP